MRRAALAAALLKKHINDTTKQVKKARGWRRKIVKKMGRPTDNPKPYKITVRLDAKSKEILDAYCRMNGTNQMEAVRRAIQYLGK